MSTVDDDSPPPSKLVLLHRLPIYTFPNPTLLHNRFTILDPRSTLTDYPTQIDPFLTTHSHSIRALVCVGPSPLDAHTIGLLPFLECVVVAAAGVDRVDLKECKKRGIVVANAGDAFSEDVADYVVGLLVDVLRKVSLGDGVVRGRRWARGEECELGFKLSGKRVGIVGLGSIGMRVAERLVAFGCTVAYNSQKRKLAVSFPYYENAHDLALDCDILILCCSLTEKTRHLINKDVMTALGKGGVIINVGRGALVDEKQMVQYLVEGKLRGAGLDVFEDEPYVPRELFSLDSVVLSPHRAVLTPESLEALADIVVENLEAFFSGRPLKSPVSFE
ncbi:Glyoxylate/hydroxypyruvate reductase HPR3-like protein [Drosera capensis]